MDGLLRSSRARRLRARASRAAPVVGIAPVGLVASPGTASAADTCTLDHRAAASASRVCPASTDLPEEGNGTGPAIGLAAAGVVGAVLVHRARKRTPTPAGRDDA
jgi:hypothetical protein